MEAALDTKTFDFELSDGVSSGSITTKLSCFQMREAELDLAPIEKIGRDAEQEKSLLSTAKPDGSLKLNSSTTSINKVKQKVKLIVEADYYGVINAIDDCAQTLSAVIYDKLDNVEIMQVDIPFNEFKSDDHRLFKENSIFYWQIGRRREYKPNKYGKIRPNEKNFSSFRMRRLFVDMSKQQKRIKSLSEKYKNILQNN